MESLQAKCSECEGTGRTQDPFGATGEMIPCQCLDQPELDAIARERDRLPFGRAEFTELIEALDRAADEHEANAKDLKVVSYREWEKGAAFGYRCVADMFRRKVGQIEERSAETDGDDQAA